mgnify:CR=1 FL=1
MKRLFGAILLLGLASTVFAQGFVVSPQAIVVNPAPSFGVQVWLDRDTSGQGTPTYQVGEEINISVRPDASSWIYVFDVRPNGEITQIFPNSYDNSNYVNANETRTFPPAGARYVFNIAPPLGLSKVIAIASKSQLDTSTLARFQREGDLFAQSTIGEQGFIQSFAIVVRPVTQNDWVTDTVLYNVGTQPSQPQFGNIDFQSNPSRASVYLDGTFIGYTPLSFGAAISRHNVSAGQTPSVSARLSQQRRAGTVSFTSSPSGADVYVNGNYVGTTPTGQVRFEAGSYTARFDLAGYQSTSVSFDARSGENRSVNAQLRAQNASVTIQGNIGGAVVFIDGRQVGMLPNGSGRLQVTDVAPGRHELVVVAPGYATYVTTFNVSAGRDAELNVRQSRF